MSQRSEEDIEFIRDPDRWPIWPRLPLAEIGGSRVGFLYGDQPLRGGPYTVIVGNIYTTAGKVSELELETFDTLEELVEKWRID